MLGNFASGRACAVFRQSFLSNVSEFWLVRLCRYNLSRPRGALSQFLVIYLKHIHYLLAQVRLRVSKGLLLVALPLSGLVQSHILGLFLLAQKM